MSLSVAAWTWITVCWLLVTALKMAKTIGWSRTGKNVYIYMTIAVQQAYNPSHSKNVLYRVFFCSF